MSDDSDGDDGETLGELHHRVLASTHHLGNDTSPDSSLDGFHPEGVSAPFDYMMHPNLSLAGGSSSASRLHFTDNRCGDCQSCNARKATGSCKKMGVSPCSGCRDNQKCWRLSPCEYVTDGAKEEFILSQLETRARLSKRGPIYLGTLLDRYGYRLKSVGRGLERIPDPPMLPSTAESLPPVSTTTFTAVPQPKSSNPPPSLHQPSPSPNDRLPNLDNSRLFAHDIVLESTRVLPQSVNSVSVDSSPNRTVIARDERTREWENLDPGGLSGGRINSSHVDGAGIRLGGGHNLTGFPSSFAKLPGSLSATLPPLLARPTLRPLLVPSAPRPNWKVFDPLAPKASSTRFPFRPAAPNDDVATRPLFSIPVSQPSEKETSQFGFLPNSSTSYPSKSEPFPPHAGGNQTRQVSMNVPAADLSALATSIHQLAQQVAGAMSQSSRKGDGQAGLPKAPSVQLIPLTLEASGHLDAITYHTWKLRLRHQIEKLHLQEDVVLHLLLTRQNLLPSYLRDQMLNCQSLAHLLARLDVQAPHLSAALPKLKEKITSLPPSGNSGLQIELRCTELLTALENLNTLFPSCHLGREELLACLSRLGGDEILSQIHSSLNQWCELASQGIKSLNESLYDFLLTVRSNRVELRVAGELYHHKLPKERSQLPFAADNKKTEQQVTGPRPQVPGPPMGPERREGGKEDWSEIRCTLCKQFHRAARYNCPKIPDIVAGKIQLPSDVCPLCLSLCDSSGRCTNTRRPCHELRGRGGSVSLVCKLHQPKTHFQICRSCPPDVPRSLGKQKTQLCFGPARSTRESIPSVPAKNPSEAPYLRLNEDDTGEVILEATAGLCEILKCFHPGLGKYVNVFCQYDGGGGLSLAHGASELDMQPQAKMSELVHLHGLIAQEAGRLPVIVVRVQGQAKYLDISFCEKPFPYVAPDPLMTQIVFKGERAKTLSGQDLDKLPKLLFGQRLLKLHPFPLPDEDIPQSFAETWPGVQVYRSRISGSLLYGGHLAMASPPEKLVLLGTCSNGIVTETASNPPTAKCKREGGTREEEDDAIQRCEEEEVGSNSEVSFSGQDISHQRVGKPRKNPERALRKENTEDDPETSPRVPLSHQVTMSGGEARGGSELLISSSLGSVPAEPNTSVAQDFWVATDPAPAQGPWRPPPWPPPPPEISLSGEKPSQELLLAHFSWVHAVAEIREVTGPPLGSSLAGKIGTNGCLQCSPLAKGLSQLAANDQLLKAQLEWNNNEFTFERLHHEWVKFLPSGEKASIAVTRQLIHRLKSLPFTCSSVSYKLEEEFKLGKTRWVGSEELSDPKSPHHFLAPLLIVNLKSVSSPIRLCQNPAAKHKLLASSPRFCLPKNLPAKLAFNDTVHQYGGSLITPDKFSLYQSTSIVLSAGDVAGAFRQIRLHPHSQMMGLSHKLKSRLGFPTLSLADCDSDRLFVSADVYASFGQSDLPFILTSCLKMAPETFENFAPPHLKEHISPTIFRQASFVLGQLAYLDDLPLITGLRHLLEHQREKPCSPLLALLEEQERMMDKDYSCASISVGEWEVYNQEMVSAAKTHQQELIRATLKILSFCGFHLKSVDSSDPTLRGLHAEHQNICPAPKAVMGHEKPEAQKVFKENGGGLAHKSPSGFDSPFLTQMSKNLYPGQILGDDIEGLKSKHLLFSKLKGFGFSGELHDYVQFENYLSTHQNKITRRLAVSCLSQFYDPRMRHLIIPTILSKCALYHLYRKDNSSDGDSISVIGWEEVVPPEARTYVLAAVRAFFLVCHERRKRCEIIFHTSALRLLVLLSDTNPMLGGIQAFLVTGITVGGCYQGRAHPLNQKVFLNRPDQKSIPTLELFYVFKNINQNLPLLPWLESQGLGVPRSRVIIATDSSSASLQLKSLFYSEFTLRTNFLCSKTAATMISYGLDPLSHIYHFDQHPRSNRKFTFQCDKITKPPSSLSDQNIMKWQQEVAHPGWLLLHPREWNHLSRNAFVPKTISKSFLESLQVNPAYLDKIAKRLETLRSLKSGSVLHAAPANLKTFSHLLSFQQSQNGNLGEEIVRKRQRILSVRGGATAILAKALFAWERWKFLVRLPKSIRAEQKLKRKNQYAQWMASHWVSPWCGKVRCGAPFVPSSCTASSSDFGARKARLNPGAGTLPHFRFPAFLCCASCVSSGKALRWGRDTDQSNSDVHCGDCLNSHFAYQEPIQCAGTSCSIDNTCQVKSNVTYLQFTDTFNGEYVARASAVQIHTRNRALAKLLVHFPFAESSLETFEELGLDYLASSQTPSVEKCEISGWSVFSGLVWGKKTLIYAVSRQQRPRPVAGSKAGAGTQIGGRAVTRLIDPNSETTRLLIRDIHENLTCADNSVLQYHLLKLGIFFPYATRLLTKYRRECPRCRLRKGRKNQDRDKLTQNLPGPSEELASLFSQVSPHSQWMIDHTGHCFISQPDGSVAKHYVLVAVQVLLRRVVLLPVKSLKAVDLLQSMLMLSYREGSIKFVHSDPGSCSKPWATRSSVVVPPLLPPTADSNVQPNPWIQLCSDSNTRQLRERNCIFRIAGPARSHVQAEVEILVNSVKTYFAHNDENFTNHSNVDIFQFDFILSKISYFLNSRPLWVWENVAVSSLDLLTAVGRSGPASDRLGFSLSDQPPEDDPKESKLKGKPTSVKADVEMLSKLTQKLHQNLAYYFLPRLTNPYQPTSYRHRRGDKIESLNLGAILIDSDYVSSNGACCGALCRLIAWSDGKRMAILVRLKRDLLHDHSFLMKKDAHECLTLHRQPCRACPISPSLTPHLEIICRDTQNLYLVVNGPPPAPDPHFPKDNHLSGPALNEPLANKFNLPDPARLPRPHCGTLLPNVTDEFALRYHQSTQKVETSNLPENNKVTPGPHPTRRSERLNKRK